MNLLPWYVDPDFDGDQTAHSEVCVGASDPAQAHRAIRHHHWRQSPTTVQGWTQGPRQDAQARCGEHRWDSLHPIKPVDGMHLVTHVALSNLGSSELRKRILAGRHDKDLVKLAATAWHQEFSAKRPGWAMWFGERDDVDAGQAWGPTTLHAVVAALGLWHFGELAANEDGAVMRVTYRVDDKVELRKPDWRHGFPNFYFACAAGIPDAGRTRNLRNGELRCKEWIVSIDSLQPKDHLLDAECIIPDTDHCHYDLAPTYWESLAAEIRYEASLWV